MASQGPLFPGTTATLANAGTSENAEAWVSPGNIVSDNATEASITASTYDTPDISQLLVASNFGFSIPASAIIDGIVVEVDRRSIIASSGKDFRVQLATGTAFANLVGSNKAVPATIWPTTSGVATYGSSTDTWGAGLSVSQINAAGFAVMLSCQANIANADVGVDYIRVTVHYHVPTNGGFALSHPHTTASAGVKGGKGAFSQGHPQGSSFSGRKSSSGSWSTSHPHSVSATGAKRSSAGWSVSHPHAVSASGRKGGRATFAASHPHGVSASGVKGGRSSWSVIHPQGTGFGGAASRGGGFSLVHPGVVSWSGAKGTSGSFAAAHPSSVTASSFKGGAASFAVSVDPSEAFSGSKGIAASFSVSHASDASFSGSGPGGPQEEAGAFVLSHASAVAFSGSASRSGSFLQGHGAVVAFSGASGSGPAEGPWTLVLVEGRPSEASDRDGSGATLSDEPRSGQTIREGEDA